MVRPARKPCPCNRPGERARVGASAPVTTDALQGPPSRGREQGKTDAQIGRQAARPQVHPFPWHSGSRVVSQAGWKGVFLFSSSNHPHVEALF